MPTEREIRFHEAMLDIYHRAKAEANYPATRFLKMVGQQGGLPAARSLLSAAKVSDGYMALYERERLDLTVEALILQPEWRCLFTEAERRIAVNRLRQFDYSGSLSD